MPSIVKSRPIMGNNENSVLLNLDKVRHFVFLRDKREFVKKENKAIFRGKIYEKPHRIRSLSGGLVIRLAILELSLKSISFALNGWFQR